MRKLMNGAVLIGCFGGLLACSSGDEDELCSALPTVNDISGDVRRGHVITLDVLANASAQGCGALRITQIGEPEHGSVAREEQALVYMPPRDFLGSDSFEVEVSNDAGSVTLTASLSVYERIRMKGQIELASAWADAFRDDFDTLVELVFVDDATTIFDGTVSDSGAFSVDVQVFDDDAHAVAVVNVQLGSDLSGTERYTSMHAALPSRGELLTLADADFEIDTDRLPALHVGAYSSALWAASSAAVKDGAELRTAALSLSAEWLQVLAELNLGLVDGLVNDHDVVLGRAYDSFVELVASRASLEQRIALMRDMQLLPKMRDTLALEAQFPIQEELLQGSHLELGGELPWWVRGYGDTYIFNTGGMARVSPGSWRELTTYVNNGDSLTFAGIWREAKLLYAHSGSSWWSFADEYNKLELIRLVERSSFLPSEQRFSHDYDWVLPALEGEAKERLYQLADDGTFTASALSDSADDESLLKGEWTISDTNRLLTLSDSNRTVQMRLIESVGGDGALQLVRVEDMRNGALRVGPAIQVDSTLNEMDWVNAVATRTLPSMFELRAPDKWDGNELLEPSPAQVVLFDDGSGVIGFNGDSNTPLSWQVVQQGALPQVLQLTFGHGDFAEQRRSWIPVAKSETYLWVLEWADIRNSRGEYTSTIPPRLNGYKLPD